MLLAEKHYLPLASNVSVQVEPFLPSPGIHSGFSSAVAKLTQTVLLWEHSSRAALTGHLSTFLWTWVCWAPGISHIFLIPVHNVRKENTQRPAKPFGERSIHFYEHCTTLVMFEGPNNSRWKAEKWSLCTAMYSHRCFSDCLNCSFPPWLTPSYALFFLKWDLKNTSSWKQQGLKKIYTEFEEMQDKCTL